MKKYRFAVHNWKSSTARPFWFVKSFPSAYYAVAYADRISFSKRDSMYIVVFDGEE